MPERNSESYLKSELRTPKVLTHSLPLSRPLGLPIYAWHAVASAKVGRSHLCGSIRRVRQRTACPPVCGDCPWRGEHLTIREAASHRESF